MADFPKYHVIVALDPKGSKTRDNNILLYFNWWIVMMLTLALRYPAAVLAGRYLIITL